MRAGLLKEPIVALKPVTEQTALRSVRTSWVEAFRTKARVQNPGSAMQLANMEEFYAVRAIFTVRLYHQFTPTMRIRWKGQDYRILGIAPDDNQQQQVITTELVNE